MEHGYGLLCSDQKCSTWPWLNDFVIHMVQNPKAHYFYNFKLDFKLLLHFKTGIETQIRLQL